MTAHSTGGKHEDKSGEIWGGWYRGGCTDGSRSMTGTPGVRHCRRDGIRVSSRCLKGKTSVAKKKLPFYGKVIWLEVSTERGGKYMQCTETKLRYHGRCTFLDLPWELSDADELDALNAEDTSAGAVRTPGGRRYNFTAEQFGQVRFDAPGIARLAHPRHGRFTAKQKSLLGCSEKLKLITGECL